MDPTVKGVPVAILAAGASRRMGVPKLLQAYGQSSLLDHAIHTACSSQAETVVVVTGAYREWVEPLVAQHHIESVGNDAWESGQSSSVATAVRYCRTAGYRLLLIMLADQPHITSDALNQIIDAMKEGSADAYRSAADGYRGSPCGFSESCFPFLEALTGDEGARQFFRIASSHGFVVHDIEFDDATLFEDIDTPEDLEALRRQGEQ